MLKTFAISSLVFVSTQAFSYGWPNLERMVVAYDESFNAIYLGIGDTISDQPINFVDVGEEVQLEVYEKVNFEGEKLIVKHNDWKFDPQGYQSFKVTDIPAFDDPSSVYLNLSSNSQRCLEVGYFSQQLDIPSTHLTEICSNDSPQFLVNLNELIGENVTTPVTINFAFNNVTYNSNSLVTGMEVEFFEGKAKIKNAQFLQPSGYRIIKEHVNTLKVNTW